MKTSFLTLSLFVATAALSNAQSVQTASVQDNKPTSDYQIEEIGGNYRVWGRTDNETSPGGKVVARKHSYLEIGSALNFRDPGTGEWRSSKDLIEPVAGGAVAQNGPTKVIFPADLATGSLDMELPEGPTNRLVSRVLGLAYLDKASGLTVMFANLKKSCPGALVGSNQVVYSDAFDANGGIISIRYTYRKASFEQDIILENQLPTVPEDYGFKSTSTVIQVWTEFFTAPQPTLTTRSIQIAGGISCTNEDLNFGGVKMGRGKAFLIGQNDSGTHVYKQWVHADGRTFLVEEVPMTALQSKLDTLPQGNPTASILPRERKPSDAKSLAKAGTSGRRGSKGALKLTASHSLRLPQRAAIRMTTNTLTVAAAIVPTKGVVLDYGTVDYDTDFTFKGDTTYYITDPVYLSGTTTFEGGAVVKFTNNFASIWNDLVVSTGGPYRPVVFTSKDDNSVGESIPGSTGIPSAGGYYPWLNVGGNSGPLHDFRFSYAYTAICPMAGGSYGGEVWNSQFIHCTYGIQMEDGNLGPLGLHNLLFSDCERAVWTSCSGVRVNAEQITADVHYFIGACDGDGLYLTNSIINGNWDFFSYITNHVVFNPPGTVFQAAAGGHYYLANSSPYRQQGTMNISPAMLAELKTKTTYPPLIYANQTFSSPQVFSARSIRDAATQQNPPDLGYHYDPIDYVFAGAIANTNVSFAAGTAVGWYRTSSGFRFYQQPLVGFGLHLADGKVANFQGTQASPDYWVRCNTVQEQDLSGGFGPGGITGSEDQVHGNISLSPEVRMNFTRCSMMAGDGNHCRDDWGYLIVRASDSEFLGGSIGGYVISCYFTNCLMDRFSGGQVEGWPGNKWSMRNCTWHGGQLYMHRSHSPIPVSVRECAFDGASFNLVPDAYSTDSSVTDYDYNAYPNSTDPFPIGGSHDIASVNFNWQTGPLGNYYLPANSSLINRGSRTADVAGLYYFTTQTGGQREGATEVDIGYHYVSTSCGGVDTVWFDDAVPQGAVTAADGDSWTWVSSGPVPYSGALASQSSIASGAHQHYFQNAIATMTVNTGDKLIAYVYLDPANLPSEVMLQWHDETSWEHRAYWGANALAWAPNGTAALYPMGALPASGQWVRLEVPASVVGLEGHTVSGMAFTLYDGRATWDYAGKNGGTLCYDTDVDGLPDYWESLYGLAPGIGSDLHGANGDPDRDGLSNLQEYQLGSNPVRPDSQNITIGGYSYKQMTPSALPGTGKAYDVYYRPDGGSQWRRISSIAAGQPTLTLVKPDAGEGDYIFLDATDTDGDGLSDGYENWFTYNGQRTLWNFPYSIQNDFRKDGWKVTHGLNPLDNTSVNASDYRVTQQDLTSQQKHDFYYQPAAGLTPASYDPLKLFDTTTTTTVRPVVTITDPHVSPSGDVASFTITRDVGTASIPNSGPLVVYYALGGALTYGRDYLVDPPPQITSLVTDGYPRVLLATIPAGQNSVTVTVSLTPKVVPGAAQLLTMTLVPYSTAQ